LTSHLFVFLVMLCATVGYYLVLEVYLNSPSSTLVVTSCLGTWISFQGYRKCLQVHICKEPTIFKYAVMVITLFLLAD
jgi:hypothetical protein